MNSNTVYDSIEKARIVAVMRGGFVPEVALRVAGVMMAEGFNVFELTMNSQQPLAAMQAVKREFGDDACVGMGTVLNLEDAKRALDAGADFVVSPAFQPEIAQFFLDAGVFIVPGVITPSEAVRAWQMGASLLKLFPIGALGIEYFKAMFGPLDHMRFMCNGATNDENARAFLQAGAVAIGMGGWLTGDGAWPESKLRSRAFVLRNIVDAVHAGKAPAQLI